MEYYGNLNNKRLAIVDTWDVKDVFDDSTEIGFINKKDMLFEYALNWFNNGTSSVGIWVPDEMWGKRASSISIKPKDDEYNVIWSDAWKNMKKIKRNKVNYYIGEAKVYMGKASSYGVFMELPRIGNDKNFTWKRNDKYDTEEATISGDVFSFEIIVKPNGNALINVRYVKCENKHRNNVTMAQIDVYNASNKDILDAIKAWKRSIKQDLEKGVA